MGIFKRMMTFGAPIRRPDLYNKAQQRREYREMGGASDAGFSPFPPRRTPGVRAWAKRLMFGPER